MAFVLYDKGQIKDKFSAGFGNAPLQCDRHSLARSGLCLLECVGVDVQRCGGLRVAQGGAHRPGIGAAGDQQCGVEVPELVNTQEPLARFLTEPPQPMIRSVGVHRPAVPINEQPVGIMPYIPQLQPFLCLCGTVLF